MAPGWDMELRNHPKMVYQGRRNWPPKWIPQSTAITIEATGEVGVLEEVRPSTISRSVFYLTMVYQSSPYFGTVHFDDGEFAQKILKVLKENCGRSLVDVGSLEVG